MQEALRIHEKDKVAVALQPLSAGQQVSVGEYTVLLTADIPAGHKFALTRMEAGEEVIKYGYSIGKASRVIQPGEWVHTHNVKTGLGELLDYEYRPMERESTPSFFSETACFNGYRREDGSVGIRNEIWIVPTVGCVNDVARLLEKRGREYLTPETPELVAFTHPYGCSQLGEDHANTQKLLAGLIHHPNAAGVLVLGLGCENNNIGEMKKILGEVSSERVKFLVCQECIDELEQGLELLKELIRYGSGFSRERIPISELVIGMKCGGSDGFSGITANPTVGAFSDLLIARGGTTILTEVPEMFGAETILMNRCADEKLFYQTVSLINDFKQYFIRNGQPVYENPSPGNKQGGISTLEDKSLGCTQKSGDALVRGVLKYGDRLRTGFDQGLLLLSSPGNDLVASTALAAAGAHLVLFTTGRGTPFGAPVPTLKISSNTPLFESKKHWIDFDSGRLLSGRSLKELSEELFRLVLAVAEGQKVRSEENGYRDMAIFKQGITL